MLSERVCKALTAYVDGELTQVQREAVLRVVRNSAEARAYLERLQNDSRRLKALPRKQLGTDFSQKVLNAVSDRRLRPHRALPVPASPRRFVPVWVGVAAAASILMVVGLG